MTKRRGIFTHDEGIYKTLDNFLEAATGTEKGKTVIHLDLFSGIGGFTLAVEDSETP